MKSAQAMYYAQNTRKGDRREECRRRRRKNKNELMSTLVFLFSIFRNQLISQVENTYLLSRPMAMKILGWWLLLRWRWNRMSSEILKWSTRCLVITHNFWRFLYAVIILDYVTIFRMFKRRKSFIWRNCWLWQSTQQNVKHSLERVSFAHATQL